MRRPRYRTVTLVCAACGSRYAVEVSPKAYVRHVWGRDLRDPAWTARCVCGDAVSVTVGEAFRAA